MAKQNQEERYEQPQNDNQYHVRLGWFVIPIILAGLYAYLSSIMPSFSWNQIMTLLNVQNRERYTMLALLCLSLILVASIWRILRK